jgi:hypothetical protein
MLGKHGKQGRDSQAPAKVELSMVSARLAKGLDLWHSVSGARAGSTILKKEV